MQKDPSIIENSKWDGTLNPVALGRLIRDGHLLMETMLPGGHLQFQELRFDPRCGLYQTRGFRTNCCGGSVEHTIRLRYGLSGPDDIIIYHPKMTMSIPGEPPMYATYDLFTGELAYPERFSQAPGLWSSHGPELFQRGFDMPDPRITENYDQIDIQTLPF